MKLIGKIKAVLSGQLISVINTTEDMAKHELRGSDDLLASKNIV